MHPQLQGINADTLCFQEVNDQEETGHPRRFLAQDIFLKDTQYASFNKGINREVSHRSTRA